MRTRSVLVSQVIAALASASIGFLVAGCATTAKVPAEIAPNGQVELNHTHWTVVASEAGFDGRKMEIRRTTTGNYVGTLTDKGHLLGTTFGATIGTPMMELIPKGGINQYGGYFTPFAGQPLETTFSISADGQELKCSLQSFRWVRVAE
jgi:hypothetical protein